MVGAVASVSSGAPSKKRPPTWLVVWYRSVCEFPTGNVSESLRSPSVNVAEVSLLVLVYGKTRMKSSSGRGAFVALKDGAGLGLDCWHISL